MKHCFVFTILGLVNLILAACTGSSAPSAAGVYNTYVKERVKSLDPVLAYDIYTHQTLMQIYEGLLHYNYVKRPLTLEPLLAEALPQISADGLTYTFKIKRGVHFHDSPAFVGGRGRELVAEDFIYSWKRLADVKNKSESFWVVREKIIGLDDWREKMAKGQADYSTPVAGLLAPDSHTLVIRLTRPDSQLLYLLASAMTVAVPREAVEHYQAEFVNHAVGTGPFRLESWSRGSKMVLTRNPSYRRETYPEADGDMGRDAGRPLPLLNQIVVHEITEEQPQWLQFMAGQLDMLFVPKDYLSQVVRDGQLTAEMSAKGMKLQLAPSLDVVYISFNTENRFLKNKKLRQALSMAYDKDLAIKTFFAGLGVKAHGPIPPSLAGYREKVQNPNGVYDVARAKALLAEAGYPEGRGLPEFYFDMGASHPTARQMAEFFKNQMALIGVKIRLRTNTWAQFNEKIKKKQVDIFDMSWNADYPDAENFLQMFYSKNVSPGPNNSNFKNAQFDALFEQAAALPAGAEKTRLAEKMEDLIMEEAPWIFTVHRVRVVLTQKWLRNHRHEYMVLDSMKYLSIDRGNQP